MDDLPEFVVAALGNEEGDEATVRRARAAVAYIVAHGSAPSEEEFEAMGEVSEPESRRPWYIIAPDERGSVDATDHEEALSSYRGLRHLAMREDPDGGIIVRPVMASDVNEAISLLSRALKNLDDDDPLVELIHAFLGGEVSDG